MHVEDWTTSEEYDVIHSQAEHLTLPHPGSRTEIWEYCVPAWKCTSHAFYLRKSPGVDPLFVGFWTSHRLNPGWIPVDQAIIGRGDVDRRDVSDHQHRELLVTAGWLALLLGCLHYDLGEREHAEAARQAAYHAGLQAGHGQIVAWSYELAAWFALTKGRYHDVVAHAQAGQQHAGVTSAMVQLVLQQARGQARLGERRDVHAALGQGAKLLEGLPKPEHPENHFVFDHTKWIFYAADCYTGLGDDEPADEHAREIIAYHTRPDGSANAPMRSANSHMDLGVIGARHGGLDQAVHHGLAAFGYDRKTESLLLSRAADLDRILRGRYPGERLADDFHERYLDACAALRRRTHSTS